MHASRPVATSIVTSIVIAAALALSSCQPPPPSRSIGVELKAEHFTGSSGIRVFTVPDPNAEFIAFHVRYKTGSVDDPVGKEGLAHLVEHLLFTRTVKLGGKEVTIGSRIDEISLFHNAFTNHDVTHYYTVVPQQFLSEMFAIEMVRISTGCDGLSQQEFEREKEVVRNEIRFRSSGDFGKIYPALLKAFYGDHPYSRPIGGDDQSLQAINLNDVCKFMQDNYAPSKVSFYVVGNVNPNVVRKNAVELLGRISARKVPPPKAIPPVQIKPGKQTITLDVESPYVLAAWRVPIEHKAYPLFNEAMGTLSSRMSRFSFTYEFGNNVSATTGGGDRAPIAILVTELRSVSKLNEGIDAIKKSGNAVEFNMPSENYDPYRRDMFDARSNAIESLLGGFESPLNRGTQFANLDDRSSGKRFLVEEVQAITAVTSKQLKNLASRTFNFNKAAILYIKPSGQVRAGQGSNKEISHESNKWKLPADPNNALSPHPLPNLTRSQNAVVEDYRLSSGMRVILARNGDLPLVRASLSFAVGSADEPDSRPGLAQVAGRFQGGNVTGSQTRFNSRELKSRIDTMIDRLAFGKRGVSFNQDSLEKSRKALKQTLSQPSVSAQLEYEKKMSARVFGSDHPYAKRGHISAKTLGKINSDDLKSFGRKYYGGASGTVVVAGNYDLKLVKQYIAKHFDHWDKRSKPAPPPAASPPSASNEPVTAVDSSATQLSVAIDFPGARGIDELYPARLVVAAIANGRLRTLREERGITYGAASRYSPALGPGRWSLSAEVDPSRASEGVRAFLAAINSLRTITEADENQFLIDFVLARRTVVKQLLLGRSLPQSTMAQLMFAAHFDLPLSYQFDLATLVARTTPEQVRQILASELSASRQVVGLVGSAKAIADGKLGMLAEPQQPSTP